MERYLYLIIKDGRVIPHADIQAMYQLDGVEFGSSPKHKKVLSSEWYNAGGTAYINENGDIILGIPEEQRIRRESLDRIAKIQSEIARLEKKRERSQAEIVRAQLAGSEIPSEDKDYFTNYSNQIDALRIEMADLSASLPKED
jgi:hypothetical protein